jgi:hypothetical protein
VHSQGGKAMFGKKLRGLVTITLQDVITGKVKSRQRHNLVVDNGEKWIAKRFLGSQLAGGSATLMRYIEVGKGSLAATGTQTQLKTTVNVTNVRKLYTTQDVSGATWNIIVNYGTSDANTSGLKEAGIFGCAVRASTTAPGMLARTVFSAVNKTNADTLKIQWQINCQDDGV